ncbi:hypothetical protein P154DRAFT_602548 [Amniculicola lignicola CBS 123094]|uniref:BTB domain-containing protein n=1 Tax=Amniculicola lignicola CBS 123094 TaxID=1392246 RepID=A0A6A5WAM1_9PLEO|nr:hypothetical protein P154DRAFT_602548 [Amniculicola lignicola CBS 123094]
MMLAPHHHPPQRPLAWPYSQYETQHIGLPNTFIIGPERRRFDVHAVVLAHHSPVFRKFVPSEPNTGVYIPLSVHNEIVMTQVPSQSFALLMRWIYEGTAPYCYGSDQPSVRNVLGLWIIAGKLGLYTYQNAIMRLVMACMQTRTFILPLSTVQWVYSNLTDCRAARKFRKFVILLWVQRSGPVRVDWFRPKYANPKEVWADAVVAQWILDQVRVKNPVDVNGEPVVVSWEENLKRLFNGEPKQEIKWKTPDYLVWGPEGDPLPDGFFVDIEEALEEADVLSEKVRG